MREHVRQFHQGEQIPGTVYRVQSLIGRGGMGSVYQVEHIELGRVFVLKALHTHLASRSDLVGRMRNEWRALAKLNHPNIVQVTDAGQTQANLPYYVMEFLEGATLSELLRTKGELPLRWACSIMMDVLSGLSAAHATGAIHRDIKPANIFVLSDGVTKLLDFGIAKLRDSAARVVTAGGVSVGTPRYMAPEQAEGTVVDGRADIYAVALVLYELVTGKGPFAHIHDSNELVMAHIGVEPQRADRGSARVTPVLADLLQRWLSKSPDSRPHTAEIARRELSALRESLPDDVTVPPIEVTTAGSYDASTLGAEAFDESVQFQKQILPASAAEKPLTVTETVNEQSELYQQKSFLAEEKSTAEGKMLRGQRTLGWGTLESAGGGLSSAAAERQDNVPNKSDTQSGTSGAAGGSKKPVVPARSFLSSEKRGAFFAAFATFLLVWAVNSSLNDWSHDADEISPGFSSDSLLQEPTEVARIQGLQPSRELKEEPDSLALTENSEEDEGEELVVKEAPLAEAAVEESAIEGADPTPPGATHLELGSASLEGSTVNKVDTIPKKERLRSSRALKNSKKRKKSTNSPPVEKNRDLPGSGLW